MGFNKRFSNTGDAVKHRFAGQPFSRTVVYFHGAPGGPSEVEAFQAYALTNGVRVVCQDRFALPAWLNGDAYFQALADDVAAITDGQPVDVAGFSIGAFVALQVCRVRPQIVRQLHLVSPAAPLEGGAFLNDMAGKTVFQLASSCPLLFNQLSRCQAVLVRHWPDVLIRMLFATAQAGDQHLVTDKAFRKMITHALTDCFDCNVAGYVRDVRAYVSPWAHILKDIHTPTHLWHGEADNWSPIGMSNYLSKQIPSCVSLNWLTGLSHYSCLLSALEHIINQIKD